MDGLHVHKVISRCTKDSDFSKESHVARDSNAQSSDDDQTETLAHTGTYRWLHFLKGWIFRRCTQSACAQACAYLNFNKVNLVLSCMATIS